MVKNIDACKIGRASRSKAISHSYSGATVNQLTEKFGNHQSEKEFSTVIIHVGTNDLVRDEPKKVAANLENLINKVKKNCCFRKLLFQVQSSGMMVS
jgi:lysophospholipase L1-like esterase